MGYQKGVFLVFFLRVSRALGFRVLGFRGLRFGAHGFQRFSGFGFPAPEDPLKDFVVTPSMASMVKWVYIVFFLSGFQICLGVYTIHLTIEGNMG